MLLTSEHSQLKKKSLCAHNCGQEPLIGGIHLNENMFVSTKNVKGARGSWDQRVNWHVRSCPGKAGPVGWGRSQPLADTAKKQQKEDKGGFWRRLTCSTVLPRRKRVPTCVCAPLPAHPLLLSGKECLLQFCALGPCLAFFCDTPTFFRALNHCLRLSWLFSYFLHLRWLGFHDCWMGDWLQQCPQLFPLLCPYPSQCVFEPPAKRGSLFCHPWT